MSQLQLVGRNYTCRGLTHTVSSLNNDLRYYRQICLLALYRPVWYCQAMAAKPLTPQRRSARERLLAAAEELARLGPVAKAALPALAELRKNDSRAVVRDAAGEAIRRIQAK